MQLGRNSDAIASRQTASLAARVPRTDKLSKTPGLSNMAGSTIRFIFACGEEFAGRPKSSKRGSPYS